MTEKRNIHALIEKEAPSLNNLLDPNDVKEFKKWLLTTDSPKLKVVDNWLENYNFDQKLHDRFRQYFTMLDSVRGTDFAKTFKPSWA